MRIDRIVNANRDIMGGDPVFAGTQVPARTLIDALKSGESIDHFLERFPTVNRDQAIAFVEAAAQALFGQMRRSSPTVPGKS